MVHLGTLASLTLVVLVRYRNVEQHIIKDVLLLLCKIAEKSDRLINNSTPNLAECWMHIRTKFDGGKVHNLCNFGLILSFSNEVAAHMV
jgi:hypothetical protein